MAAYREYLNLLTIYLFTQFWKQLLYSGYANFTFLLLEMSTTRLTSIRLWITQSTWMQQSNCNLLVPSQKQKVKNENENENCIWDKIEKRLLQFSTDIERTTWQCQHLTFETRRLFWIYFFLFGLRYSFNRMSAKRQSWRIPRKWSEREKSKREAVDLATSFSKSNPKDNE